MMQFSIQVHKFGRSADAHTILAEGVFHMAAVRLEDAGCYAMGEDGFLDGGRPVVVHPYEIEFGGEAWAGKREG